jgi:hypothetical protein
VLDDLLSLLLEGHLWFDGIGQEAVQSIHLSDHFKQCLVGVLNEWFVVFETEDGSAGRHLTQDQV